MSISWRDLDPVEFGAEIAHAVIIANSHAEYRIIDACNNFLPYWRQICGLIDLQVSLDDMASDTYIRWQDEAVISMTRHVDCYLERRFMG